MRNDIMGVLFDNLTLAEAVDAGERLAAGPGFAYVVTPNPEIVNLARQREDYRQVMTMSGPEDEPLQPLVKAADKISAVIKCVEERISGNRDFSKAEQTITQAIRDMKLPEADYFMEEFLPSYGLTIEEQDYTREAGLKFSESSQMVFSKVLK